MIITVVNSSSGYKAVCDLLHRAQKAESEATGVLFNTNKLSAEDLRGEIENNKGAKCLGAYDDGKLIGTLCVFIDKKNRWYTQAKRCLEIKYVAVAPESQGKHVGSSLLDYVKSMEKYDILNVSTGEKNINAIRYYKKNGFILVDVSRGPIHNAYKLAYWKEECPINQNVIRRHVRSSKMKCFVKQLLARPKVSKESFQ